MGAYSPENMRAGKRQEITKGEAATRQLDLAIRLFFAREDMLGVHTLAGAALRVFADLDSRAGVESFVRSSDKIRSEHRGEWLAALNRTQNFLKHADRDGDSKHKYSEKETLFLLLEAVDLAGRVTRADSAERFAYRMWFFATFPELMSPDYRAQLQAAARDADADPSDRDLWGFWITKHRDDWPPRMSRQL